MSYLFEPQPYTLHATRREVNRKAGSQYDARNCVFVTSRHVLRTSFGVLLRSVLPASPRFTILRTKTHIVATFDLRSKRMKRLRESSDSSSEKDGYEALLSLACQRRRMLRRRKRRRALWLFACKRFVLLCCGFHKVAPVQAAILNLAHSYIESTTVFSDKEHLTCYLLPGILLHLSISTLLWIGSISTYILSNSLSQLQYNPSLNLKGPPITRKMMHFDWSDVGDVPSVDAEIEI